MLQEYKYYTECMRAIIWTNDARIIVKRPRMLSTQSVALYKTCKPKPRLSTHICVTRPQWVKTEKDNALPISGRFSNHIGISDIQSTRGILRFGVIFSKSLIQGEIVRPPKFYLGSSYQRGVSILSPLIADLSGLWDSSMQVMHDRPQELFSRRQGG